MLPATKRIYPAGSLASNVVGFANADGTGLAGLEYSFQKSLSGRDGVRTFETGLSGSPIPDGQDVVRPAVSGTGLKLTIQRDIQWKAQQAITAQVHAMAADSGFRARHATSFDRVAVVSDEDWMRPALTALSFMLPGKAQGFRVHDLAAAKAWLVEGLDT